MLAFGIMMLTVAHLLSRPGRLSALLLLAAASTGCATAAELFRNDAPTQTGSLTPLGGGGKRSYKQRLRDCWDMPSAQACYEIGLSYELGITVRADKAEALRYYDKSCGLERQPEHCEAATRLRESR